MDAAIDPLERAELTTTVTTLQGAIFLSDYPATRCVEAVVHGLSWAAIRLLARKAHSGPGWSSAPLS